MATIITVHGTFAGGEETGSQWWQRGGAFEKTMRDLVAADDGTLDFVPHRWDGLNSEMSRQRAGAALAKKLREQEKRKQHYCIVAHSHGGSVALSALTRCVYRRRPLDGLGRWITVGTPFVQFARKRLLFSRLGLFGKAAWVSLITWLALALVGLAMSKEWKFSNSETIGAVAFVAGFMMLHATVGWIIDWRRARAGRTIDAAQETHARWYRFGLIGRIYYLSMIPFIAAAIFNDKPRDGERDNFVIAITIGLLLLVPVVMSWIWRRVPNVRRWIGYARLRRRDLSSIVFARWLSFRHPQDEAVEGLQRASSVSFDIFNKSFATSSLTFVGVLLLPVLSMLVVASPALSVWITRMMVPHGLEEPGLYVSGHLVGDGHNITANLLALLALPVIAITKSQSTAVFFLSPVLFLVAATALVALTRLMAAGLSRFLSAVLNRIAWNQIKASAYGNDTLGEVSITAAGAPVGLAPQPALPAPLAAMISTVADQAAAATVSKFRTSLNRLAFSGDTRSERDLIADYLTWDELVHTAYFKVEMFNKYVAYVIANSKGFKPTAAFLADPDYLRLAAWYADYHVREQNAAKAGAQRTEAIGPRAPMAAE